MVPSSPLPTGRRPFSVSAKDVGVSLLTDSETKRPFTLLSSVQNSHNCSFTFRTEFSLIPNLFLTVFRIFLMSFFRPSVEIVRDQVDTRVFLSVRFSSDSEFSLPCRLRQNPFLSSLRRAFGVVRLLHYLRVGVPSLRIHTGLRGFCGPQSILVPGPGRPLLVPEGVGTPDHRTGSNVRESGGLVPSVRSFRAKDGSWRSGGAPEGKTGTHRVSTRRVLLPPLGVGPGLS